MYKRQLLISSSVDCLDKYLDFLRLKGRSHHTIATYQFALRKFLSSIPVTPDQLTEEHLFDYIASLSQHQSPRSVATHLAAVKGYLLYQGVQINWHRVPIPNISYKFRPVVLSPEDVASIINHPTRNRTKLMFQLGYEACLRSGELCHLKVEDLDKKDTIIHIYDPEKHGVPTGIPITQDLYDKLKYYIPRKRFKTEWIFNTRDLNPVNSYYFSHRMFTPVAKKLGIDCRYHDFARHTRLTQLIKDGTEFTIVHKISRHKSPAQTMYYISLAGTELKNLMEATTNPSRSHMFPLSHV